MQPACGLGSYFDNKEFVLFCTIILLVFVGTKVHDFAILDKFKGTVVSTFLMLLVPCYSYL